MKRNLGQKTEAIEKLLHEARIIALAEKRDINDWLPKRRYLQKVVWCLSLAEIESWSPLDTKAVFAKLDGKDAKSVAIKALKKEFMELAAAIAFAQKEPSYVERAKRQIEAIAPD